MPCCRCLDPVRAVAGLAPLAGAVCVVVYAVAAFAAVTVVAPAAVAAPVQHHDAGLGELVRRRGQQRQHRAGGLGAGRYVAFSSHATNLVSRDTNGRQDVFVRDVVTGKTRRASVATGGAQGDRDSSDPDISADGRYVAFMSSATNLVSGDTNRTADIFMRDLVASWTSSPPSWPTAPMPTPSTTSAPSS